MRVAVLTREVMPEGGLTLSAFRLATALTEIGHEAEVLYAEGEPPSDPAGVGRKVEIGERGDRPSSALGRILERGDPDLILVGTAERGHLRAAAAVAPTCLHAHLHIGTCADEARFWSRLRRPCTVTAGPRCVVLRPVLGCSQLKRTLEPRHVTAQGRTLEILAEGGVGIVCVSTDQAELYRRHGVPKERITVLPNLGIRAGADELRAASGETPEEWRSATAFVGRLSKAKGGQVIGRLAASLPPESRLRVFGEGYMAAGLAARAPGGTIFCGHVSQRQVLGVMMWARSAVFPSLWPEPGGIVGIDAQVIGVPVTAFEVGAARYWPGARRFPLGEVDAMAGWLGERRPRDAPRDPDAVAAAQAGYWSRVGRRGAEALGAFAADGRFGSFDGAPAEELIR